MRKPPMPKNLVPKNLDEKIAEGNPWYVDNQIPGAPHQKHVIEDRITFILASISLWRTTNAKIRILDAGCGDGFLLRELVDLSEAECYGLDYNPIRVENARRNAPGAIVAQKDLISPGIAPEFFDVIVVSQVLEHIDDDEKVLRNLAEILKPGGLLIIGVPNEGCVLGMLRNTLFEPSISKTTDHVHFYTEATIREKIDRSGLVIKSVYREGFMCPHQRIGNWLESRKWGHKLSGWLGNRVKSQCGGFYFVCTKK